MKSIREKVKEMFDFPYIQDAFEEGANYVLEQIEDVLTNPRRYVNPDKSVEEAMVDALIKCVEQLKNNQ